MDRSWEGRKISEIRFEGVTAADLAPLPAHLALQSGTTFHELNLRTSVRQLYASGLYAQITASGIRQNDSTIIIFQGAPQAFLHSVVVLGVKQELLTAQLQRATRLEIGTQFTQQSLARATDHLREALRQAGYYQPQIQSEIRPMLLARDTLSNPAQLSSSTHQVDVVYTIQTGKQARVGMVTVTGTPGMDVSSFRKVAKLKAGSKMQPETFSRALQRLQKRYKKKNHVEATIQGDDQQFNATKNVVNFHFIVDPGPLVHVAATGAHVENDDLKRLVPVYEEGAVDADLLNEGDRNLRDHFQKRGYFDAQVTHAMTHPQTGVDSLLYTIALGPRQKVVSVRVRGNHYFDKETIQERLSVVKADMLNRYGLFSQSLMVHDTDAINALYKSNGFTQIKVTPRVMDAARKRREGNEDFSGFRVEYVIDEGPQQRFGTVALNGVDQVSSEKLVELMNARKGQPYSLANIAGDRTALLTFYYHHGFSQVEMTVTQHVDASNPNLMDVDFNIKEGKQFFVDHVLISGVHYTRPGVVQKLVDVQPNLPLDRGALSDTQRRLYNLALFSEVDTAVVNPQGEQQRKDVLINISEAHRWNYDYGLGFEVQTGRPQRNCPSAASLKQLGVNPATFHCSPNGTLGASERVSFDVSRINLRGRNQTVTLRTAYGSLEQQASLVFENPNFYGHRKLDFSVSGGYFKSQDITTYAATSISSSATLTQRFTKPDTFIYSFAYRYVYVDAGTLQVSADLIPLLSQPVRVSGPGLNWVHDTRNDPLDAAQGWYLSAQQFLAWSGLGAQADFNRLDITQANYFTLNKRADRRKWIIARSTRLGIENTYGKPDYRTIPLPERLYAGGVTSHRGFSINSAGPRDLQTGYPIGGDGAFINTLELRVPPIALPYVGKNLGFAVFNDMGNVYASGTDIWSGLFRFRQPNRSTCYNISGANGVCNFNYNAQALGAGPRYKTPIGPIRVDFSYNLNPTIYPVILSYSGRPPYVGNSGHFNFFFSIGQAF